MELFDLSLTQTRDLISRKEISPVDLVEALLARIDALDLSIQAWEFVDSAGALERARQCERSAGKESLPPLFGVPVGVKDIVYTADMPTTSGSPIFKDFKPSYDATVVARLRDAGAILLGKTVTVQFAYQDPPRTRNPWNLERTPGGSSSGSAAAVAARMVPAALGTQTGGSIIRPAAYCGVVGLKPTYGRVSRYGVTPASWSLDHVGPIARSVEDVALLLQVLAGPDGRDAACSHLPVGDYPRAVKEGKRAPVLGLVPDYLEQAQPEVASHLRDVAERFARAGAEVKEVRLPQPMPLLLAVRAVIGEVESANLHSRSLEKRPNGYAPKMKAMVQVGQLISGSDYIQAQRLRRRFRPEVEGMLEGVDCLLMPSVSEVAPNPSTTGDASFQGVWSLFGFPSITLPSGLSAERLPLHVQLVARPFGEETLLGAGAWCEGVLGPLPAPC